MSKTYIIVGGVAGGMSAATRLRRLDEQAKIIVFEKGPNVSFANCGLPYYVSGEINSREKLVVQTAQALSTRFNLDVREMTEVVDINPETKEVTAVFAGKEYQEKYDDLILSPGARPFVPNMEGLREATNVFTLRNIPDVDKITQFLDTHKPQTATVIGAGFIGLEMAENLQNRGIQVTIVEKAPHVLPTIDQEMAVVVQNELIKNGVNVLTNIGVTKFQDAGKTLTLENEETITTDIVILSVGVVPETTLAQKAGIELGLRGGIKVDERYETSVKDIYAVGDAIIVNNQITNVDALISLASPANRQGRQVADILNGLPTKNKGSIGTAIVRVFNLAAASTGISEQMLMKMNLPFKVVHTRSNSHAGYYPGSKQIFLKLIFHPVTGEIYGAQAVGEKGIDKRIDVLATAIKGGLTVFDLPELELTYAPPFGSAKDAVNMIGYAAMNIALGLSDNIQWYELEEEIANGAKLLDVRNPGEIANGGFKNSINIPLDELRQNLDKLDKNQEYIISCQSGLRSYNGERILKQNGFKVKNLDGAFALYQTVGGDLLDA
ncbi:MAG: FAD-dependent oxidoreductase [Streptococcaceae bacterium]|jgi:NADPH-dependent 2,4-dienoyl-CoA reductase/sulfur reductase-like enzyme/rhodanese-related sulfurtransferase|nr:FAD-dependent oxidoreductase [Streptococcaceae bacterium]